ncbi:hypothetical protein, conserved [Eimeria tenella]|uniref:Transmembrane protein n=1 Tax=Eimeria tenella TaxID=5802 RepID=U6L404_EIMTE|nr:hypothetical protein, conserved [Eimeria tenella]CDJ42475.1 hypothetical protein, conserved [Eimeria tenella]|eukprot:XP_013233225.1 hypothetical protein, conserved [Eimeria tenella]
MAATSQQGFRAGQRTGGLARLGQLLLLAGLAFVSVTVCGSEDEHAVAPLELQAEVLVTAPAVQQDAAVPSPDVEEAEHEAPDSPEADPLQSLESPAEQEPLRRQSTARLYDRSHEASTTVRVSAGFTGSKRHVSFKRNADEGLARRRSRRRLIALAILLSIGLFVLIRKVRGIY